MSEKRDYSAVVVVTAACLFFAMLAMGATVFVVMRTRVHQQQLQKALQAEQQARLAAETARMQAMQVQAEAEQAHAKAERATWAAKQPPRQESDSDAPPESASIPSPKLGDSGQDKAEAEALDPQAKQ